MASRSSRGHAATSSALESSQITTPSRSRHGRARLVQDARIGSPVVHANAASEAGTSTPQRISVAAGGATPTHVSAAATGAPAATTSSNIAQNAAVSAEHSASALSTDKVTSSSAEASNSRTPAIAALHAHLAASLFNASCADIKFRVLGRIYSLHRVVLVQASFFHDLLAGEFSEAKSGRGVWRAHGARSEPQRTDEAADDAIELHFDDCNITRAAFEYCIATLYGAAPELVLPEWASPTPSQPLTRFFGPQADSEDAGTAEQVLSTPEAEAKPRRDTPPQHPATPRFLLSLLATATYLGIPSLVSRAVTLVVSSLTPYTISHYVNFALGSGIRGALEAKQRRESGTTNVWDWELEGPAWGLAALSTPDYLVADSDTTASSLAAQTRRMDLQEHRSISPSSIGSSASHRGGKESNEALSNVPGVSTTAISHDTSNADEMSMFDIENPTQEQRPHFYYGTQSDRIGEVCSCWLLRWGADLLLGEENMLDRGESTPIGDGPLIPLTPFGQLPSPHAMTADDYAEDVVALLATPRAAVWCHPRLHGLPASTVREVISNDGFWVRTEWDRFEVARRVVAMRRAFVDRFAEKKTQGFDDMEDLASLSSSDEEGPENVGKGLHQGKSSSSVRDATPDYRRVDSTFSDIAYEDDADEKEYVRLFSEGIYYTHMSFAELSAISTQTCPSTGLPYTPVGILQEALWSQSELRNLVVSFPGSHKSEAASADTLSSHDEQEGTAGEEQANTSSETTEKEVDLTSELDLGLTSLEEDFGKACKAMSRRGRASRAHLGDDGTPLRLGGIKPSMQLGGAPNALEGMLSRRFHAVGVDDTIRVGENLFSLAASSQDSSSLASIKPLNRIVDKQSDSPSGIAALTDTQALPLSDDVKRGTADGFFGLRNAVKTGKILGREQLKAERHRERSSETDRDETQRTLLAQSAAGGGFGSSDVPYTEWTGYEPMRMGLEFYGVDRLAEKQRMYSPSFFYAGSVWNLYVQTVRKPKGLQLGIYLHRQNHNDPLPLPSMFSRFTIPQQSATQPQSSQQTHNNPTASTVTAPPSFTGNGQKAVRSRASVASLSAQTTGSVYYTNVPRGSSARDAQVRDASSHSYTLSPSPSSTSQQMLGPQQLGTAGSSVSVPGSGGMGISTGIGPHNDVAGGGVASAASAQSGQNRTDLGPSSGAGISVQTISGAQALAVPYVDQRRVLHAFFSIYCPSPTGTCMTKFSSEPDNFSLSQSWGWKSSSLLGHVSLEDQRLGFAKYHVAESFRCIVTIGLV